MRRMELRGARIKLFYCFIALLLLSKSLCVSQITISGNPTSLCSALAGSGNYTINPIANAIYTWAVPNGIFITSGQGTNSIITSWTALGIHNGIIGNICITVDSLGTVFSSCLAVDLNEVLPVMPPSITGPAKMCPGDTVKYSVALVSNASSYNWNNPFGSLIVSGNGNDTVIIAANAAFTAAGNVSVAAQNSCGISQYRTRTVSPNILTAPSFISGQGDGVCKMSSVIYSCPPVIGAQSYQWNITGGGATIVGANNDTTLIVDYDSTVTTEILSVNATNGCGDGSVRSLTVAGKPAVAGPISGPTTVCTNATYPYSVATVNGATDYTWTVPAGAIIITGQGTKNITVKYGPVPASNITVSVKTANDCGIASARALNGISLIACSAGIAEYSDNAFNLFPNPVSDQLIIDLKNNFDKEFTTEILNVNGQTVFNSVEKSTVENQLSIDTGNLSSGVYMLLLRSKNFIAQKRFIID